MKRETVAKRRPREQGVAGQAEPLRLDRRAKTEADLRVPRGPGQRPQEGADLRARHDPVVPRDILPDDARTFEQPLDLHPEIRGDVGQHMDKGEPDGVAVVPGRETMRSPAGCIEGTRSHRGRCGAPAAEKRR
jgi:hypothetical protein